MACHSVVYLQSAWLAAIVLGLCTGCNRRDLKQQEAKKANSSTARPLNAAQRIEEPTFHKDVAPIIYQHCAGCHRPGQTAPFTLLDYLEIRKRAKEIVKVIEQRVMPPWLPEPGYGTFVDERRLGQQQIEMIQRWVSRGMPEGTSADALPRPQWTQDWYLGKPDLTVKMPRPYQLAAEGPDVYRNFVVPVPLQTRRFVRAIEFRPGNPAVVHHTFIKVDRTGESRRLEQQESEPGFSFMITPMSAQIPEGHFLGWTPGRIPSPEPEGLAWAIEPGTDLVLQMHLRRSGKPETLQSEVGFFFTDRPPTQVPFTILLTSRSIDIPAGENAFVVEDSFRMPADVDALAVLPHAHYLGKEMRALARLPDGSTNWLLFIKDWNFNWQSDYRYARPIFLPKDTVLSMQFKYDNSLANIRNPHQPPRRVTYGPQATDEMAELWLQVLPRRREDFSLLVKAFQSKMLGILRGQHELALRLNPDDVAAHTGLGAVLLGAGEWEVAADHLRRAIELRPASEDAHFYLGYILRKQKRLSEAAREYQQVVLVNPTNHEAHGNLGLVYLEQGKSAEAEAQFETALRIFPNDRIARQNLEFVRRDRAKANKP